LAHDVTGRAVRLLVLALALGLGTPAQAGPEPAPQSVEELKAALAELRRRLADRQAQGEEEQAAARLRTAQQQIDRLVASLQALRRERDRLRADLAAARAELAARPRTELETRRRLEEAQGEIARLRRLAERPAKVAPPIILPLASPEPTSMAETVEGWVFAPGSAELSEAADGRLVAIADAIRARPTAHVRVIGHSGGEGGGGRLALDRAERVRARLVELLPAGPRAIEVEGRGAPDAQTDAAADLGDGAGRRVVVMIEP
jgi:flagellar motor protein MotB